MKYPATKFPVSSFFFLLFTCFVFSSCKKSGVTDSQGNVIVKGEIQLTVHVLHHSWGVSYINVYLKRNATQFPGRDSTKYELMVQADPDGYAVFENLYPGNYYAYTSGQDYYFGAPVIGYMPFVLNSSSVVNNKASLTLYVSE
jgi:hypothetical protein